jgi:hypothetical protein
MWATNATMLEFLLHCDPMFVRVDYEGTRAKLISMAFNGEDPSALLGRMQAGPRRLPVVHERYLSGPLTTALLKSGAPVAATPPVSVGPGPLEIGMIRQAACETPSSGRDAALGILNNMLKTLRLTDVPLGEKGWERVCMFSRDSCAYIVYVWIHEYDCTHA